MKFFQKAICAAAVACAFIGNASAGEVVLHDWQFNPTGSLNTADRTEIGEFLDVVGSGFIQLTKTGGSGFTFTEHATFIVKGHDGEGLDFAGGNVTAMFEATGSGTFGTGFSFAGGTIKMYQNPGAGAYGSTSGIYGANLGTLIASFDVQAGGGGQVDASGQPISNGQITVLAKADVGDLVANRFYDKNGVDLATSQLLSFAFTNASTTTNPSANLIKEVGCDFSGFAGACNGKANYHNVPGDHFFIGGNGQFKLAQNVNVVPEPGSLALFGLAMLGAGVISRKRKQA